MRRDDLVTGSPQKPCIFIRPARAQSNRAWGSVILLPAVVIARHLECVFADGSGHDYVVHDPVNRMRKRVIRTSGGYVAVEDSRHTHWPLVSGGSLRKVG